MDKADKQMGSSSSFTVDLFGPKASSKSLTSSTDFFGSIFGPPVSMVPGKDLPPPSSEYGYGNAKHESTTDYKSEKGKKPNYENGRSVEPCYYNSSIYYGGQEDYSPTTRNILPTNLKKDGIKDDQNESNSSCASRGNWWQGSLYY